MRRASVFLFLPVAATFFLLGFSKKAHAIEIKFCLPSILCLESTTESGGGSGGPWDGVQFEPAPWEGAEPHGPPPENPSPPPRPGPPPIPPWEGHPRSGSLSSLPELKQKTLWFQDTFVNRLGTNPGIVAQNAQSPLNHLLQGQTPTQTNARLGDPVDPVTGALLLNIPLVEEPGGYQNLVLTAHHNHQFSSPIQMMGRGWSITGNEAILSHDPEEVDNTLYASTYVSPTGAVDFAKTNNIYLSGTYKNGLPLKRGVGGNRKTDENFWPSSWPSITMAEREWVNGQFVPVEYPFPIPNVNGSNVLGMMDSSGQRKIFAGAMFPRTQDCSNNQGSRVACVFMLHFRQDLLDKFIPIGYFLAVRYVPATQDYQYMWHRGKVFPTHWLTEVQEKDKLVLSIRRRTTYVNNFDFPGRLNCGNYLQCMDDADLANPDYPYRSPLPDTFTTTYTTGEGQQATVIAKWHLQRVYGDWENNNDLRVFQFVPYIIQIDTSNGRQWKFDYGYPSQFEANNCNFTFGADHPGDVVKYMSAPLHDIFGVCQPYNGGTLTRNVYTGPLFLKAIHYPDPVTGLATGPLQTFELDQKGRISKVFDFSAQTVQTMTYDAKNRVASQKLGSNPPITYSVPLGEGAAVDLMDGLANHFMGYQVQTVSAAGDLSQIGVEDSTGQVRYIKEWFPNDAGVPNSRAEMKSFEYRPNLGVLDMEDPNWPKAVVAKTLRHVVHHQSGLEEYIDLRGDTMPALTPAQKLSGENLRYFFRAFQTSERRFVYTDGGQQKTLRWTYQYHPNDYYTVEGYGWYRGLLQSVTDPLQRVTSYTYDFEEQTPCITAFGLPTTVTLPDGTTEKFQYNNKQQVLVHYNRLWASTSYQYYGTLGGCSVP